MKVEILKNKNGEDFYPLSHTKSTYDDNGESLDDKLKEIEESIDNKYEKPTDGISKNDLSSDVQESLNKADTSIQSLDGYATEEYVTNIIQELPEPMIFKGSLGVDGTITILPSPKKENTGFTYKVITDGTYDDKLAKVGDTFISDGKTWVLIPSGDEPSGTVTSIGLEMPNAFLVSNSPITESGNIKVEMANGYSVPSNTKQTEWDGKQDGLNTNQLNAVNSGITSDKVNTYDGYASAINSKYTKPKGNIPKSDLSNDVQTSLGKADSALQSFEETDPTVPSYVKNIKSTDITNWNNKVDSEVGKSLIADSEVTRLASVHNYDDTEIKEEIDKKADKSSVEIANTTTSSTITDSADGFIRDFTAYGKTEQEGIPTVTAPLELKCWDGKITTKNSDGSVQTVVDIGIILLGMPTDGDGNYIDKHGQHWLCDKLDIKNGKIVRYFKKGILSNPAQSWVKSTSYSDSYYISNWVKTHSVNNSKMHLQTHFKTAKNVSEYLENTCYFTSGLNIRFPEGMINSVDELKAWFNENTVEFIYQFPSPMEEALTEEQINSIKQLKTYSDGTIIEYGGLEPFIDISYWKGSKDGQAIADLATENHLTDSTNSLIITNTANGCIRNFRAFGNCAQDGIPTPTDSKEIIHWDGLITSKDESGISTTINTGISLYGIKVSDNGNYIDSNGQQWLCDYVDMNSRKIIRNTKMEFLNSNMDWTASSTFKGSYQVRNWAKDRGISRSMNCILNRFIMQGSNTEYSIGGCYLTDNLNIFPGLDLCPSLADFKLWIGNNPTQIVYALPTPLEEDLDDSQFEKLLQVKTYSHKTTFEFGTLTPFFTIDYWIDNYNGQIIADIDTKVNTKVAELYSKTEVRIGTWIDNKPIYRKVVEVTEGLAKDNTIKVCNAPEGMNELIRSFGTIKTTEGAYSNSDILVYYGKLGSEYAIYAKQNFTSYPEKMYITLEYTKS